MQVVAGFLFALVLVVAPWVRRDFLQAECVRGRECLPIQGVVDLFAKSKHVNVLIVHGMGANIDTNYARFSDDIAGRLGLSHVRSTSEPIPFNRSQSCPAWLVVHKYSDSNGRTLSIYELHWWPLIEHEKEQLLAEEGPYLKRRAIVNRRLKTDLVNKRIADPIIYLGPAGDSIRHAVKFTICRIAGGVYDGTTCQPAPAQTDHAVLPTIVATESLGSEIFAQSLKELSPEQACDLSNAAYALEVNTPSIFMLANQLPLLRFSRPEAARITDFSTRCTNLKPARKVIAVSDPSDLLSYPISSSLAEPNVTFINVFRQFGHRLALTSAVEPLGAHIGAKADRKIIEMVACGYPSRCPKGTPRATKPVRGATVPAEMDCDR